MRTPNPRRANARAAVRPAIPAPAMTTRRDCITAAWPSRRAVDDVEAALRQRLGGLERCRVAIERRAVGADLLCVRAHVEEYMRMIEGRVGAHAHEFFHADLDHGISSIVLEVGNGSAGHGIFPSEEPVARAFVS